MSAEGKIARLRRELAEAMEEAGIKQPAPSAAPRCPTCNDNGLVGGPSFYAPDEGGVPCPDCMASNGALWSVKAVQDLSRVKQWLNDVPEPGTRSVITMMRLVAGVIAEIESNASTQIADPVAWAVYWGIGDMRLSKVCLSERGAHEHAAVIKSQTEVRPLYAAPQPDRAAALEAEANRLRAAVKKAAAHVKPTCFDLFEELQAALAAKGANPCE